MSSTGPDPQSLSPPLEPMLARLARHLPVGDGVRYEPKWDGFRCLAFRAGDAVDLRSRNQRPLARYFPEVVEAIDALPRPQIVLDGELLVIHGGGADFAALMARLHPAASRVARLARETPARYVVFDLLAEDDRPLLDDPFAERRRRLEIVMADAAPPLLVLCPSTADPAVARRWLTAYAGSGIDGVVAKDAASAYEPGRRTMTKVKLDETADCVIAGFRWMLDRPLVASLLLGLYDDTGELRHVGVASAFRRPLRDEITARLAPLAVPLDGHPWELGFALEGGPAGRLPGSAGRWTPDLVHDWVPVSPALVCEVAYDQVDGHRLRHAARWRRWRPDRDPGSCRVDQLDRPAADVTDVLGP
jgi:ATP-dependent DNA ligase